MLAAAGLIAIGCSGGGSSTSTTASGGATTGHATVVLSDPATCQAPSGAFSHVYLTITDVKANVNAGAGDNDTNFVDLTPGLSSAPKQIDLLGQANNQCFLATLGDALQLQPGSYQQIRMILADNAATVAGNACGGSANCVVLKDGSVHQLELSSEAKTGIKIPSGQIASGAFNIAAGQTKDLDIDLNTCTSIVQEGNGKYRLKPVLHAGEVSTTSTSINGTVVDSVTGNAVNGPVLVAIEQKDATGVDRVFMNTLADAQGKFVFCPLPSGTYDVVIVGTSGAGAAYAPTVVTGVATGSAMSLVKLYAQLVPGTAAAVLAGTVSTAGTGATSADVQVSALSRLGSGLVVTIPMIQNSLQSTAVLALDTLPGSTCASGTDCGNYSISVPAASPYSGAFSASGATLTAGATPASYKVDALAYQPSSGGTADCGPSEIESAAITPVAGVTAAVPTIAFVGCQ